MISVNHKQKPCTNKNRRKIYDITTKSFKKINNKYINSDEKKHNVNISENDHRNGDHKNKSIETNKNNSAFKKLTKTVSLETFVKTVKSRNFVGKQPQKKLVIKMKPTKEQYCSTSKTEWYAQNLPILYFLPKNTSHTPVRCFLTTEHPSHPKTNRPNSEKKLPKSQTFDTPTRIFNIVKKAEPVKGRFQWATTTSFCQIVNSVPAPILYTSTLLYRRNFSHRNAS